MINLLYLFKWFIVEIDIKVFLEECVFWILVIKFFDFCSICWFEFIFEFVVLIELLFVLCKEFVIFFEVILLIIFSLNYEWVCFLVFLSFCCRMKFIVLV